MVAELVNDDEEEVPSLVRPDWNARVMVDLDKFILTYDDGEWRFQHTCVRPQRGTIVCAPLLNEAHKVTQDDPLTIEPSILCPDCGNHGWVREGRWIQA